MPVLDELLAAGLSPTLLFGVIILGFGGVKAGGMLPLHIWLPKAHPVAPAPASALLSALMIKTGAYGFFRFFTVILSAQPQGGPILPAAKLRLCFNLDWGSHHAGRGVNGFDSFAHETRARLLQHQPDGLYTFCARHRCDAGPKRGGGRFGRGLAAHDQPCFFLNPFCFCWPERSICRRANWILISWGGLGRRMPKAFLFFLIAAAGITGIPGFNGYASKVLIHEAILHAYHLKGWDSLLWLERTFVFTGGLTAAYISKIWLQAFVMRPTGDYSNVRDLSGGVQTGGLFAVYSAILLSLGIGAQRAVIGWCFPFWHRLIC